MKMSYCEMNNEHYTTLDESCRKHGLRRVLYRWLLIITAITFAVVFFLIIQHHNSSDCQTTDTECILRHERFKLFDDASSSSLGQENTVGSRSINQFDPDKQPCGGSNKVNCRDAKTDDSTERSSAGNLRNLKHQYAVGASDKKGKQFRAAKVKKPNTDPSKDKINAVKPCIQITNGKCEAKIGKAGKTKKDDGPCESGAKGSEKTCQLESPKINFVEDLAISKDDDDLLKEQRSEMAKNVKWRHIGDTSVNIPSRVDKPEADDTDVRRTDQASAVEEKCSSVGTDGSACKSDSRSNNRKKRIEIFVGKPDPNGSVDEKSDPEIVEVNDVELDRAISGTTKVNKFAKVIEDRGDKPDIERDRKLVSNSNHSAEFLHELNGTHSFDADNAASVIDETSVGYNSNDGSLAGEASESDGRDMRDQTNKHSEIDNLMHDAILSSASIESHDDSRGDYRENITAESAAQIGQETSNSSWEINTRGGIDDTAAVSKNNVLKEENREDNGRNEETIVNIVGIVDDNIEPAVSSGNDEFDVEHFEDEEKKNEHDENEGSAGRDSEDTDSEVRNVNSDEEVGADGELDVTNAQDDYHDDYEGDIDRDVGSLEDNSDDVIDIEAGYNEDEYVEQEHETKFDDDGGEEQHQQAFVDEEEGNDDNDDDDDDSWTTVEDMNDMVDYDDDYDDDDDDEETDRRRRRTSTEQHLYHSEL